MSDFARPFRVTYPDGEFVNGAVLLYGDCTLGARTLTLDEAIAELDRLAASGAVVEWADGGQP